jgi:hypothetical protein
LLLHIFPQPFSRAQEYHPLGSNLRYLATVRLYPRTAEMVKREFDAIGQRLDNIEKILLAKQEERLEKLERQVKEIREALALNP